MSHKQNLGAVAVRLVFMSLLLLAACASCMAPSDAKTCAFHFDKNIQDEIVVPVLSQKFGKAYVYYNFDSPSMTRHGNRIELVFDPTRIVNGERLADESGFVIVVDACTHKVIDSYVATW